MLRVAICDDEADEVKKIERIMRDYDDFDVSSYTSSKQLAWAIEDGADFDLYLLDVVMPKPDGIELARLIRETDGTTPIIYLTSHDGRALDAFRVRASQYLTKPIKNETLRHEVDAALTAVKAKSAKTFLLKTKNGQESVPFHRIMYCELVKRNLCCVMADGKNRMSITLRTSFEEAVSPLFGDKRFIRPHNSYMANLDYVKSIQGSSLIMKNEAEIPIAHGVIGEIKEKYLHHFFGGDQA